MNTEDETVDFLRALCRMTGRMSMLELGTYHGYTAAALGRLGGFVTSVDIQDQRVYHCEDHRRRLFKFILGDSRTFDYGNQKFDFVFFDTVHERDHLVAEFDHIKRALLPGAILAFHDPLSFPGVNQFLSESGFLMDYVILPTPKPNGQPMNGLAIATLI